MVTNLLSERKVMELLGSSRSKMQRLRKAEDPIPHYRFGKEIYYDWEKVLRWAERQAQRELAKR